MSDDHDKSDIDKKILSLLKDFYQPEQEEDNSSEGKEFEVFFRNLKQKIDNDSVQKKVSGLASDLEHQYLNRQQRLFQAKNRLESGFFTKKKNKFKSRKLIKNSLIVGSIILSLGLAGIATFKNNDAYKVIDFQEKEKIWEELNLNSEQKNKIYKLEKQWQAYKNFENEKIQIVRTKLFKEINKKSPDLVLVDKYQREIFDLEMNLKKQEYNASLEKRFVLNQNQSLKYIRGTGS